jgi:hypothetical protein
MKKFIITGLVITTVTVFYNCHSAKKAQAEAANIKPKVTYETDVQNLVSAKCSPCHFPSKGGNKKPFDSYEAVHANIDSMIFRIELNPGQKGFMPFKNAKLSDSVINVFKEWRSQGAVK